jgi:uncharacterized protein (DUF305 family)
VSTSRRAFLAGIAGLTGPASAEHRHGAAAEPGTATDEFATQMHRQMTAMSEAMAAAPMSGDADRDFLAMMIPHHQGAVGMARLVLVHGRDPLTRQLAEEIIASQQTEIASMQARLGSLANGPGKDGHEFPALAGTRG